MNCNLCNGRSEKTELKRQKVVFEEKMLVRGFSGSKLTACFRKGYSDSLELGKNYGSYCCEKKMDLKCTL